MDFSITGFETTGQPFRKKFLLDPYLLYMKVNFRWTKNIHGKKETIKILKENMGEYFLKPWTII